jgi:hypothetical protein
MTNCIPVYYADNDLNLNLNNLNVNGNGTFNGNVAINGDASIGGDASITGDLTVNGTVFSPNGLNELSDVTITTPIHGEIIQYNSNTSLWENKAKDFIARGRNDNLLTSISIIDTYVVINLGNVNIFSNGSYFSTTGGSTTYNGIDSQSFLIGFGLTCRTAAALGTKIYEVALLVNSVEIAPTIILESISLGQATNGSASRAIILNPGDIVQLAIRNKTDIQNVNILSSYLNITEL